MSFITQRYTYIVSDSDLVDCGWLLSLAAVSSVARGSAVCTIINIVGNSACCFCFESFFGRKIVEPYLLYFCYFHSHLERSLNSTVYIAYSIIQVDKLRSVLILCAVKFLRKMVTFIYRMTLALENSVKDA